MPYFLGPGRHASVDIPASVAKIAEGRPGVALRVSAPLGVHPLLADVILDRCR